MFYGRPRLHIEKEAKALMMLLFHVMDSLNIVYTEETRGNFSIHGNSIIVVKVHLDKKKTNGTGNDGTKWSRNLTSSALKLV